MPDGDDVVMKGSDDEVRGEQSFSAFPHVRAGLSRASRGAPVSPPPCRNWRCCPCVSDKSRRQSNSHAKIADMADGHPHIASVSPPLHWTTSLPAARPRFAFRAIYIIMGPFAKC